MTDAASPDEDDEDDEVVRAAGGLVTRPGRDGPEVLVVHRPRDDDWSLPKGKLDPGERDEAAALREVAEETGVRARIVGTELTTVRYVDRRGRPKQVRFWPMEVERDLGFTPTREIDEVRWISVAEAATLLTYAHDRSLVASLEAPP